MADGTSTPVPLVSVVVPTHNRPGGLAGLLAALERQTLEQEHFEVIVVDDGSIPPAAAAGGHDVRVLAHERSRGPAAARNTGWRAARAPLVAFVDDDCAPVPGWLEALVAEARGDEDVIVQGPVEPPPAQRDAVGPLSHVVLVDGPDRLFVTCNVAYARRLLERLGGFDEWYRQACGEDVELGARALKAGARTRYAEQALVHHAVSQPGLRALVRHTLKWQDSVRTIALHPELRDLLVARIFWKRTHPPLLLCLASLGTRRPGAGGLAALLWFEQHRRAHRGDSIATLRALPSHLVVDLAELWTALRGSIRHRTLML